MSSPDRRAATCDSRLPMPVQLRGSAASEWRPASQRDALGYEPPSKAQRVGAGSDRVKRLLARVRVEQHFELRAE
jgi:hypothetical protein